MPRNLIKEAAWKKQKYCKFNIDVDKKLGEDFKEHMKKNKKKITVWFTEKITEEMKKEQ